MDYIDELRDLNDPKVALLTPQLAAENGLEPSFVAFVFAAERPQCFRYWCEDFRGGWTCFVPDDVAIAYPLWSCNADQTLLLTTKAGNRFGKGWHDHADIEYIANTTQGLLASLLNSIWEPEVSEQELRNAASFCGFRYVDDIIQFSDADILSGETWSTAFSEFIADIDAKSG